MSSWHVLSHLDLILMVQWSLWLCIILRYNQQMLNYIYVNMLVGLGSSDLDIICFSLVNIQIFMVWSMLGFHVFVSLSITVSKRSITFL